MVRAQVMAAKIPLMHVATIATHRFAVNADTMKKTRGKNFAQNVNQKTTIKMKTETPPPTIAELWGRFDSIKYRFGSHEDYSKLIDLSRYAKPAQGRIDWVNEITSLRRQLVERCSVPCYNFSASPLEEIEYHKEMSAIHGFWAWELEQQKREAQNEQ